MLTYPEREFFIGKHKGNPLSVSASIKYAGWEQELQSHPTTSPIQGEHLIFLFHGSVPYVPGCYPVRCRSPSKIL